MLLGPEIGSASMQEAACIDGMDMDDSMCLAASNLQESAHVCFNSDFKQVATIDRGKQ